MFGGHGHIIEVCCFSGTCTFRYNLNTLLLLAYRASEYLETLIDEGAIVPKASEELDKLYAEYDPLKSNTVASTSQSSAPLTSGVNTNPTNQQRPSPNSHSSTDSKLSSPLLLTGSAIPAVVSLFNLTGHSSADMYRALEQARLRGVDAKSTPK